MHEIETGTEKATGEIGTERDLETTEQVTEITCQQTSVQLCFNES